MVLRRKTEKRIMIYMTKSTQEQLDRVSKQLKLSKNQTINVLINKYLDRLNDEITVQDLLYE